MTWTPRRWMWLLLCAGLTTCATAQPSVIGDAEAQGEIASFEELCAEEERLLPLCIGPQCGLYRCREVMAHLTVGRVVPAYAEEMVLPLPGNEAQRYWGSSDGLPESSQPVFIIPWGPRPLLPSQKLLLEDKVQIEQFAGQLIADFMRYGLVIPYRQRLWKTPPLGSY